MVVMTDVGTGQLAELVKQVQAGNVVLLTQCNKPVARLVAVLEIEAGEKLPVRIRSLTGHRVLAPNISQSELAEDMWSRFARDS